jgi:hypothetical protein
MISKLLWTVIILGTLVMVIVMVITGKPLKTPETPSGIIALELAGTNAKVQSVLTAWRGFPITNNHFSPSGFRSMEEVFAGSKIFAARKNTLYDFIFIIFYTSLFVACCKTLSRKLINNNFFSRAGKFIAKAAIVAALLDVIENIGMLLSLFGKGSDTNAMMTMTASSIKWLIVFCTIVYIVVAFLYWKTRKSIVQ